MEYRRVIYSLYLYITLQYRLEFASFPTLFPITLNYVRQQKREYKGSSVKQKSQKFCQYMQC